MKDLSTLVVCFLRPYLLKLVSASSGIYGREVFELFEFRNRRLRYSLFQLYYFLYSNLAELNIGLEM